MQHKIDGAITYTIGGIGISMPIIQEWLSIGTTLFGFLAAVGGFFLVCLRIRYEMKKK